jgi:hypothetical protein
MSFPDFNPKEELPRDLALSSWLQLEPLEAVSNGGA